MKVPLFKLEDSEKNMNSQLLICFADSDSLKLGESLALGCAESPGHPLLRKEIAPSYAFLNSDQIEIYLLAQGHHYAATH